MKNSSSKGGATALMLASIAILVVSVGVTLVFALRARQDGEPKGAQDGVSLSAPKDEPAPSAQPMPRPGKDYEAVEPDWEKDELLLDELAAQPWTTAEGGQDAPEGGGDEPAHVPDDGPAPVDTPAAPPDEPAFVNPFSDVKESDYFYEPLMWAARCGIVSGETFSPGSACSRAQTVTFLWRQQGSPEPKLGVSPFSDVSQTDYFFKPVLWAFESGLISTPSDGKFHPNDSVNRAQVMTFLYRLSGGSADRLSNPFSNVRPGDYYYDAALWAYDRGVVILDEGEDTFDAASACTRGQFITFLYRCFADAEQGGS